MTEPMIMILLSAGPICWMIGGYRWKFIRREIWPIIAGIVCLVSGIEWWRCIALAAAMDATNRLPYGEYSHPITRLTVFCVHPSPALIINVNVWPVLIVGGIVSSALFLASRKVNWITHKIWEGFSGFLQSSALVCAVLMK